GDSIRTFRSGDVVLVGANLPHHWSFDEKYLNDGPERPNVYVAHFSDYFWGKEFLSLPENVPLKNLLEIARRGIQVNGKTREYIGYLLQKMLVSEGSRKILFLLEV